MLFISTLLGSTEIYDLQVEKISPKNGKQEAPSVRRARPPVGVQSTDEQLLQTTTVWEWLNTVVLQDKILYQPSVQMAFPYAQKENILVIVSISKLEAYIWKQPAHLTSMKKELGD